MAKLGDPTDFSYRVNKVTKVVDGDTIDVIIDLGFDIMYKSRVRLFGIDTPESKALLAYKRSVDQMCKFLGAKSLFFLSLEGTYKALGYKKRDYNAPQFTDHCFTGDYPI